jgi:hypothetical protein
MTQATHPRDPGSEAEAWKVIAAFFPLFSRRDVRGLLSVVNFPHIRVTPLGAENGLHIDFYEAAARVKRGRRLRYPSCSLRPTSAVHGD